MLALKQQITKLKKRIGKKEKDWEVQRSAELKKAWRREDELELANQKGKLNSMEQAVAKQVFSRLDPTTGEHTREIGVRMLKFKKVTKRGNITFDDVAEECGREIAEKIRDKKKTLKGFNVEFSGTSSHTRDSLADGVGCYPNGSPSCPLAFNLPRTPIFRSRRRCFPDSAERTKARCGRPRPPTRSQVPSQRGPQELGDKDHRYNNKGPIEEGYVGCLRSRT
jgi:hypothetical protein